MGEALSNMLDRRSDVQNSIQELTSEKAEVEREIFKRLIKEERVEYFTINWRKLHTDKHKNRL